MNISPQSYKIRTKLLLNFALLLGLSILSLTIYQFALDKVGTGYEKVLNEEHNVYDKTLLVKELMLRCRKNEKDFRLDKDNDRALLVLQDIKAVLKKNSQVMAFANLHEMADIVQKAEIINTGAKTYAEDFKKLVEAHERRGLTIAQGLQGEFREIAHQLFDIHISEHALGPILNSIQRIRYYSHKDDPSSRATISQELVHLKKLTQRYKARPIYLNQLNDLFGEYSQAIQHHLEARNASANKADRTDIDTISAQLIETLYPIYVPNAQALLLQIRRHEKDYLLRGEKTYVDQTHAAVNNLAQALQNNIKNKDDIRESTEYLRRYQQKFDQLVHESTQIKALVSRLRNQAAEVEQAGDAIILLSKQRGEEDAARIWQQSNRAVKSAIAICVTAILLGLVLSLLITNSITKPLQTILAGLAKMADGDYSTRLKTHENDQSDTGTLARMFNRMANTITRSNWFSDGQNQLAEKLRKNKDEQSLCRDIICFLASYLKLPLGAIYLLQHDGTLKLADSYAHAGQLNPAKKISNGEGLLGEAVRGGKTILLEEVPSNYAQITSSLGNTAPHSIIAVPISWQKKTFAVIELASLKGFTKEQIEFLEKISEAIAIALSVSQQRTETFELLKKTQQQSEELQTQQEELKTTNEELAEQAQALRRSEEELKSQQEELQVTNEELEEKAESLALRNEKLKTARQDIEEKAKALSTASQYKSEFLANMSHELRTPLNSLLLLASNLASNQNNNLNESQVESAKIIYNSGTDLLQLINDILDLSKIEAGHMDVAEDHIDIRGFGDWLVANFQHMAQDKKLSFLVNIDPSLPKYLISDRQRLEQIMRNLAANAIKFTENGSVSINFNRSKKKASHPTLAIAVSDTGIGIPAKQQEIIFDAFKQADGSTSRKYGGTGLGLSISKKLSEILDGKIRVTSKPDKGATFTLYLPLKEGESVETATEEIVVQEAKEIEVMADRNLVEKSNKIILIIEDDLNFAKILRELGQTKGFKCLIAPTGSEGLELAERHTPDAIILDIRLPDIDGWQVLDSLKNSKTLRHIPVHMMSGEEKAVKAYKKGAMGFLTKPISEEDLKNAFSRLEEALSKKMQELLIIEDDQTVIQEITQLIAVDDLKIHPVNKGAAAISYLQNHTVDCMILDIDLSDMTGFALLSALDDLEDLPIPPIIIYSSRELSKEENSSIGKYTDTIIIKGLKSEERLLDETALFLHRVVKDMPAEKRQMIANLYDQDSMFAHKKILLVDDDMRNAFALSKILEERGMKISIANDGRHALELLAKNSYDLILMDIMMPIMDGYETMSKIRAQEEFQTLPIIALTAKAMAADKGKCMAAGASDYLAKPVNETRLFSMMRVWLYR